MPLGLVWVAFFWVLGKCGCSCCPMRLYVAETVNRLRQLSPGNVSAMAQARLRFILTILYMQPQQPTELGEAKFQWTCHVESPTRPRRVFQQHPPATSHESNP